MMRLIIASVFFSLTACATTAGQDWTRFSDGSLNEWLDQQAVPGLTQTLSTHPRFKSETIRVATLESGQVAGRSDGLTTAIRGELHSALLQEPGLNIVSVDGPENCTNAATNGYYLSVEASASGGRGANVQLRLFDIVEQQWVSGFGYQWRGDLSHAQREALQRPVIAETARGLRVLPFTADQSDLLAEKLAADLACQLKREGNDELIVQPAKDRAAALIAGNLAGNHQIPVGADGMLDLETRVHKVDDQLYQVWAILTPDNTSSELSAITSSAYATRPLLKAATNASVRHAPATAVIPVVPASYAVKPRPRTELLSGLAVLATADDMGCSNSSWRSRAKLLGERPVIEPGACFGLEFERDPGAQVYVIRHQVDAGLLRLYPTRCNKNEPASRDSLMRFPRATALTWDNRSGMETVYVIAARGSRATGRLDRLIAQLPDSCDARDQYRPADSQWLTDIDIAVRALDDDVAWQAVRIYHQSRADAQRLRVVKE